jgi:hypothetical protein
MKQQTFQKRLETFCWRSGDKTPVVPMPLSGVSGVSWCDQRKINPLSTSIETIVEFLTGQYKEGKAYRSINVYRSALSAVLPLIDSWKVGSHPLVSQLLRGIFNLRPPQAKYSHTESLSAVGLHKIPWA